MTLTELRYIVAVTEYGHFGKAAASCHVSQPTLSVAIRRLEEEFALVLFERDRNGARVTRAGEQVIEQARRVLAEAATLQGMVEQAQDPLDGTLRLGVIPTVGPYLLPHLIPRLRTDAPAMPLIVEENLTRVLMRRLLDGDIDALIAAESFTSPGIETRVLYTEPFHVAMPHEHPLCSRAVIDPLDLEGEHVLLLGPGHCFRDQVLTACPQCIDSALGAREGDPTLQATSLETIRYMVASGTGVSILPAAALPAPDAADPLLCVRRFREPQPRRQVVLAWRQSFPRRTAIDTLARTVQGCTLHGTESAALPPAGTAVQAQH